MQAVLMDAGGVLYRRARTYRHLRSFLQQEQLPAPPADDLQRLRNTVQHRLGAGADRDERYSAFLVALGVGDPGRRAEGLRVLVREAGEITLLPDVAATLRELKARGFKLGVITNTATPGPEKQSWLVRCGIDVAFDSFIASCDFGAAKPDPRIYRAALADCGIGAADGVFVGHAADELQGARAVGLYTVACAPDPDAWGDERIERFAALLDLPCLKTPTQEAAPRAHVPEAPRPRKEERL